MRILVITPFFHPHPGGSQRYIEELYSRLVKANRSIKVDVICYNTDGAPPKEKYRGLQIYRVPAWQILPGQFAIPDYGKLWQLLRQLKAKSGHYDLVNSHTRFFDNSWWAPLAARFLGAQSLLTDHCASHPVHHSSMVRAFSRLVDTLMTPVLGKLYDQVSVVSQATQQFLNQLGIPQATIIYPGIDPQLYRPRQAEKVRRVPGIERSFSSQEVVITFVGRLIPAKGVELVITAAQKLTTQYPQLHVVIAGDGPLLSQLKKQTSKQIHVLGRLSAAEVALLLSVSDGCVLPSTHHEGFPLVLLEAGASGCAVATTDQGGNRELIVDGQTGWLITPTLKSVTTVMEQIITQPATRKKLAKALHQRVISEFQWPKVIDQFQHTLQLMSGS